MSQISENQPQRQSLQGNQACALGAIAAGCRLFAGYPITPSSEVAERMSRELPRVDGVFDSDPEKVKDALKFDKISYMEVVKRGLKVMDTTAITLSMDNKLPIVVFNFDEEDNLNRLVMGESVGTKVQE